MSYLTEVQADSPVAHWRLGEASGNPQDSAGTNHVTAVGGTPTYAQAGAIVGDANTAITLEGAIEYFTVPDAAALDRGNGPVSWEFWAKRGNADAAHQVVFSKQTQGIIFFYNNKLTVEDDGGNTIVTETGTTSDAGTWHHWVIVRWGLGSGNTRVFKDAVDVTSEVDTSIALVSNAIPLTIGRYDAGIGLYFNGTLDELAIYASGLTAARVLAHYNAGVTGGVTAKITADSGAGLEVQTATNTGTTETGAGVDTTASPAKAGTDAGTGTDSVTSITITPDSSVKMTSDAGAATDSALAVNPGAAPIAVPVATARVDWADRGVFTDPLDDVSAYVLADRLTRGRSTDYASDAIGSRTFRLRNDTGRFTPDRNWHDNPSFEVDTTGWSTAAIASLIAAGTSIAKVGDNAPSAGSSAGEAVLPATLNAGIAYAIPHTFRAGVAYQLEVYLKSMSGSTTVEAGIGSTATPADRATSSGVITTSWAAKTFTWTPTIDRSDAVFFLRTETAAAATVRIDRIQINAGTVLNGYLEAPTKGQLIPGRPIHLYATWAGVDYPLFYGRIERISPIPLSHDVEVVCYDPLRRYQEADVVVPASAFVQRSARDFRIAVLEEVERGTRNLVANPSFATNTTGWNWTDYGGGTLTRLTSDGVFDSTCGQYVATAANQRLLYPVRMSPVYLAGQVYRFSIYLRTTSGTADWEIGLFTDVVVQTSSKTVTVGPTWTRYSLTLTLPATVTASTDSGSPIRPTLYLKAFGAGTVRLDAAAVTRGIVFPDYEDVGTGRWPNWVGNGSFDGGALNGWYDGWTNLIGNPSFETNTAGWSVAGDAFVGVVTAITRVVASPKFGTARADADTGTNAGPFYAISGTFKSGVTYRASLWISDPTTIQLVAIGIGSNGTPADFAQSATLTTSTTYQELGVDWTPTADRTDVHFYIKGMSGGGYNTMRIDGASVFRRDPAAVSDPAYADTGPGGGGSFVTDRTISTTAKYGSQSQQADTPATAGAGRVYDFNHLGSYFVAGQAYTMSVWIRPTGSSMPYKIGIAANKGDGTFDEASTTGTATADIWNRIVFGWTPTADRSSATPFNVVLYVQQTDGTARTFNIDGVRVIPGGAFDDFEMPQWILAAEGDVYMTSASLSGTGLSVLSQLNKLTVSRHYVRPTMVSPFYEYVVGGRDDLAAKTVVETIVDTGAGGVEDLSPFQLDRAAIVNIVPVSYSGGVEYYSDPASVRRYGPRPGATIAGSAFFPDLTTPDIVGPALIARYKDPRARPQLRRSEKFPNLLARQVDDLIRVSAARLKLATQPYLIVIWDLEILEAGLVWRAKYGLEEMP